MKTRGSTACGFCLALTLSLLAVAGDRGTPQQSNLSSLQQELISAQKAFQDAQERGDAEYVKNAVADDFLSIETNGNTSGKKEFVRDIHPPEHPEPSPFLYDFDVVQLDNSCVVVTYKAVFPGNQLEKYQHLSDTWVKQDGQWKLKLQQSTLNLWSAHDLD
ncbi:MAG: nuclear transport factor 2 family protein [Terriglobales bacterium]